MTIETKLAYSNRENKSFLKTMAADMQSAARHRNELHTSAECLRQDECVYENARVCTLPKNPRGISVISRANIFANTIKQ